MLFRSHQYLLKKTELEEVRKRLDSKEEQELMKWSVELGRKAKKGSFKRLLKELSPEMRAKLLFHLSPEKRREHSK